MGGPEIRNNNISGNENSGIRVFEGGYTGELGEPLIIGNNITDNTTDSRGEAVKVWSMKVTIKENTIENNSEAKIYNNTITENYASFLGGGVYVANDEGAIPMSEGGSSWPVENCPPGTNTGNNIGGNEHEPSVNSHIDYNIRFQSVD